MTDQLDTGPAGTDPSGAPHDDLFVTDPDPGDVLVADASPSPDEPDGVAADEAPFPTVPERVRAWFARRLDRYRQDPGAAVEAAVTALMVILGTALVLATLNPSRMWQNTTPTGGDMGAHVWGPRYLMDHLLPKGQLTGWTPDWYNGFPAYQFYMVVPSLMIVALTVGLPWWAAVPVVAGAVAVSWQTWSRPSWFRYRFVALAVSAAVIVLAVPLPYNRSFKIVTALGLLGLPAACWLLARCARLPFPIPAFAAGAGLIFLYNREPLYNNTGNIIGGNFQSTMAGEFAFSISVTMAVLYLAVAIRGLRTGKHRALAAVLFALAGLCHLIPAFFVLGCTVALFLVHPDKGRFKWLATMVPVGGLLTAFWVLPFWFRADYVNHMGWEKLPAPGANLSQEAIKLAGDQESVFYYLFPQGLRWLIAAAVLGAVVSLLRRYSVGIVLALAWVGVMVAFVVLPESRLWNARLLPFLYLSVALLAAIGVGELIRLFGALASGSAQRPLRAITVPAAVVVVLGTLLYVTLPLSTMLPDLIDRKPIQVANGQGGTETVTQSSFLFLHTTAVNAVAGWTDWNYKGLELKEASPPGCGTGSGQTPCTTGGWPEYRDLMATMDRLGRDSEHGCGRAMWEYNNDRLNGYGTPMAPMLLPYWTDGCIGSQEGLYFESSTTVPYHFLMQSELSTKPSNPQRDIPYPGFDIDAGVRHLQMMGVKYYLASTSQAVQAASQHPDLTEVAVSGPWHVFQVADAAPVSPMPYEPVIAEGMGNSQDGWLPEASAWFLDAEANAVPLAISGPDSWKRVKVDPVPDAWRKLTRWTREQLGFTGPLDRVPELPRTRLPENEVTNIEMTDDGISFDVSKTGVPVLVKTSYFPNWQVDGAQGPYRVTPNLMVVIPTSEHVSMSFGRTPIDYLAYFLTFVGLVLLVLLARAGPVAVTPYGPSRLSRWIDDKVAIKPRPAPTETPSDDPEDASATGSPPAGGAPATEVDQPALFDQDAGSVSWSPPPDPIGPGPDLAPEPPRPVGPDGPVEPGPAEV